MLGINWSRGRIPALPDRALLEYARLEYANEEPCFLRARARSVPRKVNGARRPRWLFFRGSKHPVRPDPAAVAPEPPDSA